MLFSAQQLNYQGQAVRSIKKEEGESTYLTVQPNLPQAQPIPPAPPILTPPNVQIQPVPVDACSTPQLIDPNGPQFQKGALIDKANGRYIV